MSKSAINVVCQSVTVNTRAAVTIVPYFKWLISTEVTVHLRQNCTLLKTPIALRSGKQQFAPILDDSTRKVF